MGKTLSVGARRVIAWTCLKCGDLVTGDPERRPRARSERSYIDRRCTKCRWKHMAESPLRH